MDQRQQQQNAKNNIVTTLEKKTENSTLKMYKRIKNRGHLDKIRSKLPNKNIT